MLSRVAADRSACTESTACEATPRVKTASAKPARRQNSREGPDWVPPARQQTTAARAELTGESAQPRAVGSTGWMATSANHTTLTSDTAAHRRTTGSAHTDSGRWGTTDACETRRLIAAPLG